MRADGINKEALRRLTESHSHTVCVCIYVAMTLVPSAAPTKTYKDIIVFVNLLENSGVKTVHV